MAESKRSQELATEAKESPSPAKKEPVKFVYTSVRAMVESSRPGSISMEDDMAKYEPSTDTKFTVVSGELAVVDLTDRKLVEGGNVEIDCQCGSCENRDEQFGVLRSMNLRVCRGGFIATGTIEQQFEVGHEYCGVWVQRERIEVPLVCIIPERKDTN